MIRILLCIFVLLPLTDVAAKARAAFAADSLSKRLGQTSDAATRIGIFRNLADLYFDKPEEKDFLRSMYREAERADDKETAMEALSELAVAFVKEGQTDSVFHYMHLLEKTDRAENTVRYLAFLRSKFFEFYFRNGKKIYEDSLLSRIRVDRDNIYIRMERAYTTGSGLFVRDQYKEALPYLKTAYELTDKLPRKDYFLYRKYFGLLLANVYSYLGNQTKSIALIEEQLHLYATFYKEYCAGKRPFYNIDTRYLQCYSFIVSRIAYIPAEKAEYYQRRIDELLAKTDDPYDIYSGYLALNNTYLHKHDWLNAARTNDTLIKYSRIVAPYNLAGLHEIQARIYEQAGYYRKALAHERHYIALKDSLDQASAQEKLNKLQVEYDVDKLNLENTRLADRNKRMLLVAQAAFLLLALGTCLVLYTGLRRERRRKEEMRRLKIRAEESEKMKTAFINSMCHEIRTPLNAIVGFSNVIADGTAVEESRQELAGFITENAAQLTSSIDHILHISNLDASTEPLERTPTDLNELCRRELKNSRAFAREDIRCVVELPEERTMLNTNGRYLSLVIRNLLDNAAKFTERGTISLGFHADRTAGMLRLCVCDTGCGIPVGEHEAVFERFTKLDAFKQGNGIGLYLCRLIVTRLGGRIYVDPAYTAGTRIVISLPLD